jgi:hypothetical protein
MPPVSGFFTTTQNAPVRGELRGDLLVLICANKFTLEIINKPETLELVTRKASAKLGRPIRVTVTDQTASHAESKQMDQLLSFGRAHANIINIKDKILYGIHNMPPFIQITYILYHYLK